MRPTRQGGSWESCAATYRNRPQMVRNNRYCCKRGFDRCHSTPTVFSCEDCISSSDGSGGKNDRPWDRDGYWTTLCLPDFFHREYGDNPAAARWVTPNPRSSEGFIVNSGCALRSQSFCGHSMPAANPTEHGAGSRPTYRQSPIPNKFSIKKEWGGGYGV